MSQELGKTETFTFEPLAPLVLGTVLLDRYTVMEMVSSSETANVYLVAAARACPFCNVENQGDATECGFCGKPLPEPKLVRLREQYAPPDTRQLPPSSFVIDNYCFSFVPDTPPSTLSQTPPLRLTYGLQTDTGLKRSTQGEPNEDSIVAVTFEGQGLPSTTLALFMIADGVGGAAAGEVASHLALQVLTREWTNRILLPLWNGTTLSDETIRAELEAGLAQANARLLDYQMEHAVQIGTTLTAVVLLQREAYIVNAGDSRTYLYRDKTFAPITRDHSYVAMLVASGLLTSEDAYSHPQRNIILQSLGDAASTTDIFPQSGGAFALLPGDQILLCSDGLWELVRDQEIQQVLEQAPDAQSACAELVRLANAAGGADNISVIVIRCDEM